MPDVKKKSLDLILGRGLLTAETIASELRARLVRQLGEGWQFRQGPYLLIEARRVLAQFEPILAENIAATDLASWVAGFDEVAKKLPDSILAHFGRMIGAPPNKPPGGGLFLPSDFGGGEPIVRFPLIERAVESLRRRNVLRPGDFQAASDAARANAFTVAGDMSADTLETIRNVLAETVEEGASLDAFKENLGAKLRGSFTGPAHVETVFRTNAQAAFRTGQDELASNPIVAEVFPYKTWDAIHDARVRSTHLSLEKLGLSGTNVYRADDAAFWGVWKQPAGFNCRCGSRYITIENAARLGVAEAKEWLRTGRRPPLESRLPYVPFKPDPAFRRRAA